MPHISNRLKVVTSIVVLAVLGYAIYRWQPSRTSTANNSRQTYSALYDAAWRQDDGHQPTLVTATLMVPPAMTLLGQDTGRSSAEEQEWNILKTVSSHQLAFIITADAIAAPIPDDVFTNGLTVAVAGGVTTTLASWNPIVAPSRVAQPTNTTSSQIGIAVFDVSSAIDWQTVGSIELQLKGVSGERDRVFTWPSPQLLLQVQ